MSKDSPRLAHFPLPFFAITMGLTGLAIAVREVARHQGVTEYLSLFVLGLSSLLLVLFIGLYAVKIGVYRDEFRHELNHPVRRNFLGAIPISLLLQAVAYFPLYPAVSQWLWVVGTLLQLIITVYIAGSWFFDGGWAHDKINPAWIIPAVGNVIVPIAGVHHAPIEISWFYFSIGAFLWLPLLTLLLVRFTSGKVLPQKLYPSYFILIAPPMVMSISLLRLDESLWVLSELLYFVGLFVMLLLVSRIKLFFGIPFSLAKWAFLFPLTAATIASVQYPIIALVLLLVSCLVAIGLTIQTVSMIIKKAICVPE